MAASPRSAAIAVRSCDAAGVNLLLTVPDNLTLLVKSAYANNGTAAANHIVLYVSRPGVGAISFLDDAAVPAYENVTWSGDFVLEPGDQLAASIGTPSVFVWINGSVLQGVATIPPATATMPVPPGPGPMQAVTTS